MAPRASVRLDERGPAYRHRCRVNLRSPHLHSSFFRYGPVFTQARVPRVFMTLGLVGAPRASN